MSSPTPFPESHLDLLEARAVSVLSTVGADGFPQSTAVWYMLDGSVLITSLAKSRQKYRNMVKHPRVSLFFLDPANPYRTLEVRAEVTIEDDPDKETFARVVRHYGQDPETFPAPVEPRVKATFTPTHVVANG